MEKQQIQHHVMHVGYGKNQDAKTEDVLFVKERLRDPVTGKEKPNFYLVENYERPWYVTKKGLRDTHKQKKDVEHMANLDEYRSTQAALPFRAAKVLDIFTPNPYLSEINRSPYIYGSSISSPVLFKNEQDKKNAAVNGDWNPNYTFAMSDLETNVDSEREEIITGAVAYEDKVLILISEEWMRGDEEKIQAEVVRIYDKYVKCMIEKAKEFTLKERKSKALVDLPDFKIKVRLVKNDMEVVSGIVNFCHNFKPDFLGFWNMSFDVQKIVDCCQYHCVDPAQLFADRCVPQKYRYWNWRPDAETMVTASGKRKNKDPCDKWNIVTCSASFYVIDPMSVFRLMRLIEAKRNSYSLDATLREILGVGKMDIPGMEGNHNLDWHRTMQKRHKIEYGAYNIWDCIGPLLADKVHLDLAVKIGVYADGSEMSTLLSNPKRLANALHFYLLDKNMVICGVSDNMTEEFDNLTLDRKDWIVTLANELAAHVGRKLFSDIPSIQSFATTDVSDIDVSSGYPTSQVITNACKTTTLIEVCRIFGITKDEVKHLAVNLQALRANAINIAQQVMGCPSLSKWEALADAEDLREAA